MFIQWKSPIKVLGPKSIAKSVASPRAKNHRKESEKCRKLQNGIQRSKNSRKSVIISLICENCAEIFIAVGLFNNHGIENKILIVDCYVLFIVYKNFRFH